MQKNMPSMAEQSYRQALWARAYHRGPEGGKPDRGSGGDGNRGEPRLVAELDSGHPGELNEAMGERSRGHGKIGEIPPSQ